MSDQTLERAVVDNSSWDGNAAMTACSSESDYRSICAGHTAGDLALRSSWKLPHHSRPGAPPNAAGVRAALARLSQTQGLTDAGAARAHLEAHMGTINPQRDLADPPKEVIRAMADLAIQPRSDGSLATLSGRMATFDEWAEVDSYSEGHFMERVAQGTFTNTIERDRSRYRALYEHGQDPTVGKKPLGPITDIGEDARGAFYEVELLDTDYNRALLPGLKAGLFGSSFRGGVERDQFTRYVDRSAYNPEGLPERVLQEIALTDLGPCTFPQYLGTPTTARSLNDEFLFGQITHGEGLKRFAEYVSQARPIEIHSDPDEGVEEKPPEEKPQPVVRTKEAKVETETQEYDRAEQVAERETQVIARQKEIATEHPAGMPDQIRAEWDALKVERADLERRLAEAEEVRRMVQDAPAEKKVDGTDTFQHKRSIQRDIYDPVARRNEARNPEEERRLLIDDARRAVDVAQFPNPNVSREAAQSHVERMLSSIDGRDRLASYLLATGSESYKRAFGKSIGGQYLNSEEQRALGYAQEVQRALSLTTTAGGFAVPFVLDPSILPTSNLAVNPFRAISRVEQITVDEWRGVSSAGITASFAAEATETTDNAPTLAQPVVSTEKAQAFIPYSIEIGQDWDGMQAQMAALLADAKDELEAAKFATGTGTNEPQGVITGATTTVAAAGTASFAIADLDTLEAAVPPRFRTRSAIVMNRAIAQKVRHFDTAGGASVWNQGVQLTQGLQNQVPSPGAYGVTVLGYPAYESSAMAAVLTTGSKIAVMGDFRYYLIADRIGLTVVPTGLLVGSNHRPTGQQGLYAYWRVGAGVLAAGAFRVLVTG